MANITKQKRDRMSSFLDSLKEKNKDDDSIKALNEIEGYIKDKKFGLVFEEHTEKADEMLEDFIPVFCADDGRKICRNPELPYNFILEGDNLHALYLLEKTHKGRIDCIYIDPPYNNRAKSWKYNNDYVDLNDAYKHSKWLSMMKARLQLAKRLLNPRKSVLICTIDENEFLYIGSLLQEIFSNASITMVTSIISAKGVVRNNEFSRVEEYIFFVRIGDGAIIPNERNMLEERVGKGSERKIEWLGLRRREPSSKRGARPNQFYPIFVNSINGRIQDIGAALSDEIDRKTIVVPEGCDAVWPIDGTGVESLWGLTPEISKRNWQKGYLRMQNWNGKTHKGTIYYLPSGTIDDIEEGRAVVTRKNPDGSVDGFYPDTGKVPPKSVWNMKSHNAESYGTNMLADFIGKHKFEYPKSLYAVKDTIAFAVADNKNAIVLDFFAGSGTTLHAVNLLNAEDGGQRSCIMVTNNELSSKDEEKLTKEGFKPGDKEWEDLGIARNVTWPRTLNTILGVNEKGKPVKGDYGVEVEEYLPDDSANLVSKTSGLPVKKTIYKKEKVQIYPKLSQIKRSQGFQANVKYFKCDWVKRRPESSPLTNALCLHVKEMIELQNAIEIENKKYILILSHDDYVRYIKENTHPNEIIGVWVNQNIVFNIQELRDLKKFHYRFVPREFFGEELKEVAE